MLDGLFKICDILSFVYDNMQSVYPWHTNWLW